ncbi:MAG: S1 RNA-binding domain-containing protein [Anaerolineae bacterium]|nr:S1 RNA-binding domain-containing protein [Anaerolineae bacterium]
MKGEINQLHHRPDTARDDGLAQLLEDYLPRVNLARGQVIRGKIIRTTPTLVAVDVGAKCEGVISGRELERLDPDLVGRLQPGDEVMVCVIDADGPCGEIVLSMTRAQLEMDWHQAQTLLEKEKAIEIVPISANRGGLIVQLDQLRGFIPASQLSPDRRVPRISDPTCRQVLEEMVGQKLWVQVIEADRERNRLILSEKAAEAGKKQAERQNLLSTMKEGEICSGRVSNLTNFGAFIDVGGIDGLAHLSEISWERVNHPNEVLSVGQVVEVMILNIDLDRQRVALSLKRMEQDPWATVEERYKVGQMVECCITRLTKWGAFACIVEEQAIEGLIHVSEIAERPVDHPDQIVQPGQVCTLRIVGMEPHRHRLALSLRQAQDSSEPAPPQAEESTAGD